MATAGAASPLHSAEGRIADVLMQDFDLGEPDSAQQVQLNSIFSTSLTERIV
jgi:hypothetical protein